MSAQPSDQENFTAQANQLELEKRRLEIEKLRTEIQHESLAWWKRPGYVGGVTPLVLAILGLFSAWATGFFDTQRARLKSDVEALEAQRDKLEIRSMQLASSNAEVQAGVDQAYVSLKLAVADAVYALGHLRATGPRLSEADRKSVESAGKSLPEPVRGLIERLVQSDATAAEIVPITEQELQTLNKRLANIPASPWALELEPQIGPVPMLKSPGGKIYDPVGRKFYDSEQEFEQQRRKSLPPVTK